MMLAMPALANSRADIGLVTPLNTAYTIVNTIDCAENGKNYFRVVKELE